MRAELRGPALALAVDCALTEGALAAQGPRLVVTDVDSTFVRGEVIEMLAAAAGSEEMVREITSAAMRGELDFAQSLEKRVATLEGVPSRVFDDVAATVPVTPGADSLIAALHARGGYIGLVSGGFHEVVDQIAQPRGIDEVLANRLMVADGRLLGRTYGRIIDRQAKREALLQWSSVRGIPLDQTVAVGDGANDLGMMEAAGLSVAFCAKPVVLEQADAAITTARLDKLVALFGWNAQ
nr:phosphoserine phosphatase SerB [Changpingibacter yushuensis]